MGTAEAAVSSRSPAGFHRNLLPPCFRPFSQVQGDLSPPRGDRLTERTKRPFSSTTNVRPLSGPCDRSRIFVPFSCRRQCPLGTSLSSGKACNGLLPMAAEDGRETVRHPLTAGLSVLAYFLSPTYRSGQWESPGRSCAWNADQMTHRRPKRLIHEGRTRHA